jgi:hypothetical protein
MLPELQKLTLNGCDVNLFRGIEQYGLMCFGHWTQNRVEMSDTV